LAGAPCVDPGGSGGRKRRTAVVAADATTGRRHAAAAELARLAAAGVPGAHPDEWWGLRPLSDDRPLVDEANRSR
jgi:hypothetical protein